MKGILAALTFFIVLTMSAYGQDTLPNGELEKSPTVHFLNKRGYYFNPTLTDTLKGGSKKWPDTLYYNTVYKPKIMGSPTIPLSFSKITYENGQYLVTPTISIGYGYTWFWGDFIFSEVDKIIVEPTFFFGLIADVGLQNDLNLDKFGSVFTGAFIGFSSFNLFFGYDYVAHSASIGVGGRFDIYTFKQSALKPMGKIKEARRHKTSAVPIRDE